MIEKIRGKISLLPLMLLHLPIRRSVVGRSSGLVVSYLLVVSEEVVPLVVALVLAAKAAKVPAVVLHPLPPELGGLVGLLGLGGGGPGAPLVVHLLGGDEDHGLVDCPIAFPVLSLQRGGRWGGGGGGGGGGGDVKRVVVVGVENDYGGSVWRIRHGFGICKNSSSLSSFYNFLSLPVAGKGAEGLEREKKKEREEEGVGFLCSEREERERDLINIS